MTTPTLRGFPPLVGADPRVVILGNMPGVASLHAHQYYAHPRNAFWRITGELFGFNSSAPYTERVAALTGAGVAVWDVLASCRRIGSLDAAVERKSMSPNDFGAFFAAHPTITHACFNGAAAETNYRRLVGLTATMQYSRLPSTSPAHTAPFHTKKAAWREALIG